MIASILPGTMLAITRDVRRFGVIEVISDPPTMSITCWGKYDVWKNKRILFPDFTFFSQSKFIEVSPLFDYYSHAFSKLDCWMLVTFRNSPSITVAQRMLLDVDCTYAYIIAPLQGNRFRFRNQLLRKGVRYGESKLPYGGQVAKGD